MEIKGNSFRIIVKPNMPENELKGFDKEREAYKVDIKAKAENNKANIEVIRFFSKLLKRKVRIVSGFSSREKLLRLID